MESRECVPGANFRLSGRCVAQALDEVARHRGWPNAITVDYGTEFTSKVLDKWVYWRGTKLDYTRPGKPTDNDLIEPFNGRLCDEFLSANEFVTQHDAPGEIEGLAGRLQPPPSTRLARQPDPERVRQQQVSSTQRSGQPVVQNCPVSGGTSNGLRIKPIHVHGSGSTPTPVSTI